MDCEDNNKTIVEPESSEENLSIEEKREKCLKLKNDGNNQFKLKNYEKATEFYIEALSYTDYDNSNDIKIILYSNLAASAYHQELYTQSLDYCNNALELNDSHPKALLRRAQVYRKLDQYDNSMADYNKYQLINPDDKSVIPEIEEFKIEMNERTEKIKTEVFGKLKNIGNMVLDKFGLSTDDFQMIKDPNTGGYSINFKPKDRE